MGNNASGFGAKMTALATTRSCLLFLGGTCCETLVPFFCKWQPAIATTFCALTLSATGSLCRSSVCISCPNRRRKDRCGRFFALPGVSLRRVLPLSFGAPAQIFVNRCHACSDAEDQFFSAFSIDTF